MIRTVSVVVFFVMGGLAVAFAAYLRRYRTDLEEGQSFLMGRSFWPDVNMLNPSNYNGRGRSLLRWVYLAIFVEFAASLVFVFSS